MKIDNPSSYDHSLYQTRVNRFFILFMVILCSTQVFLSFTLADIIFGFLVFCSILVMTLALASIVLAILDWVLGYHD